jgi:hypothetical protein
MKKNVCVLVLLTYNFLIFAQNKTTVIELSEKEDYIQTTYLEDNGFITITGKYNQSKKNLNAKLSYYSSALDLIWEKTIEKKQGFKNYQIMNDYVVATPDGGIVYYIECLDGSSSRGANKYRLTQINKAGNVKTFSINNTKDFGENQHIIFCDKNYLYFLASIYGNENEQKYKNDDKIVLNRYSNIDFTHKSIELQLPDIENVKNTSFWFFVGNSENKIFLSTKCVEMGEIEKIQYNMVTVNSEGTVLNNFVIDATLKEDVTLKDARIRPSTNIKSFYNSKLQFENDFESRMSNSSNQILYKPLTGAFGNIIYRNSNFYIYGLSGLYSFGKGMAKQYNGYFIFQYDSVGNVIKKIQAKVSDELYKEGFFRIHGMPNERNISFLIEPDRSLRFQIWFKNKVFTYQYQNNLQFIGDDKLEYKKDVGENEANNSFMKYSHQKAADYINNQELRINDIQFLPFLKNDIIIDYPKKEKKITLLYFSH